MSNVLSKPPRFNGCNCNRINARIPDDYYHFEDSYHYERNHDSGRIELAAIPFSENLGDSRDYSLGALLSAGISPQSISMGSVSRFDGLCELDDFANNTPDDMSNSQTKSE